MLGRSIWIYGLALAVGALFSVGSTAAPAGSRSFEFRYDCIFEAFPEGTETAHIWLPVPRTNADQQVEQLKVHGVAVYRIQEDEEYGNRYLFTEILKPSPKGGFRIGYSCKVVRGEVVGATRDSSGTSEAFLKRALGPDRHVPVEGRPREIAKRVSANLATPLEKARSFYDWILAEMTYDKSGTGWGQGDFNHACDAKAGNCTDYHSYFLGLSRAAGMPAVFEIGFPLPPDKREGTISGYHCWAKFYIPERGWMAVDISEADRHPELTDYYFGNLTPDRVMLSRGRDIKLIPETSGEPLNFFVYPHVVADGEVISTVSREVTFRDL